MSHPTGHSGGYEKRDINVKNIAIFTFIFIVVLTVGLIMINEWFIRTKEELYFEMVLQPKNQELLQLRAREDSLMNSYGIADSTGAFRIPIDSAMVLVAAEAAAGNKQ